MEWEREKKWMKYERMEWEREKKKYERDKNERERMKESRIKYEVELICKYDVRKWEVEKRKYDGEKKNWTWRKKVGSKSGSDTDGVQVE